MKTENEIKSALHAWVVKTNGKIRPEDLTDTTPIIERRIISSLQITQLILFVERLREKPVDVEQLKPGVFKTLDVIYQNFFKESIR